MKDNLTGGLHQADIRGITWMESFFPCWDLSQWCMAADRLMQVD